MARDKSLQSIKYPASSKGEDSRIVYITLLAVAIGIAAGFVSQAVTSMIGFVTNLSFFGTISTVMRTPEGTSIGLWVILVPAAGGVVVGFMAKYGSAAIRGHGIPETMEQVLLNQSRIPPRVTILKPLSAAFAIGTGGPFGAEGPIIATGGALGSLLGQVLHTTADERKVLLAAGAAAGMSAIFGAPVSSVLLAIELLLFEFRSRSFIPVAIASVSATAVRAAFEGLSPVFAMQALPTPTEWAIVVYILIGALTGIAAVGVTKFVYWVEDEFDKLPIHWMWWPAIGGLVVGLIGYFKPDTMGVGYDNISGLLNGHFAWDALLMLAVLKFLSWAISLGSGTSGGTLAPLFTIGGGFGVVVGVGVAHFFPELGVDPRMAGLIGMAAMFTGASRALLASVVFAFETTLQSSGLLPLLGGCSAAFLLSRIMMKETIMTEKIARRGLQVPSDYDADYMSRGSVKEVMTTDVQTLLGSQTIGELRTALRLDPEVLLHQAFPVLDEAGSIMGVVSKREILDHTKEDSETVGSLIHRGLVVVFEENTLRQAADLMVTERVGRLPVVHHENPRQLIGIITRSDLLHAHSERLTEARESTQTIRISFP